MINSSVMTPKTVPGYFLLSAEQPLAGIPSYVQVARAVPGSPQEAAQSRIRGEKKTKKPISVLFSYIFFHLFLLVGG